MPFLITNVYHQWNTCNSYSCIKKKLWPSNHHLCGHFRWYKYLNCRPWRTKYIFVTPLHNKRRATASRDNLWTRNRCQQPRTSTRNDVIPSVDASKVWLQFKIYLLDRGSVQRINCPVNMVKMTAIYLLVRTIVRGAGLLIMIGRPNILCRTRMITPCQLGIQKLHIHWKYPSGSGIYSHTARYFLPAASPSTAKRSTVESTLFTVTSSPGHVNHVTTIESFTR